MNPLTPIDVGVAWAITHIHSGLSVIFGPASGWAWAGSIIILVVLMRLALVPLFIKQMHATRKMSALAPKVKELRQKYKNDKQKLNEETMRLYRENGANPLAGCLPMVAQFPLFFALFDVLRAISEWSPGKPPPYGMPQSVVASAQQAHIFGATVSDRFFVSIFPPTLDNIPHSSQFVIFVFAAISATTTFLTVRQSTKRGLNATGTATADSPMAGAQKYMAYIAPVFALSSLYWQLGLVLYWVTTNLWTLGQQFVLFKRYPMPVPEEAAGGPAGAVSGAGTGPSVASGNGGKRVGAKKAAGGAGAAARPAKPKPKAKPAAGGPSARQPAANGSGVLRRLGKGRAEAEEQPAAPEVKLVRQQRVRQSRSKRSGKR